MKKEFLSKRIIPIAIVIFLTINIILMVFLTLFQTAYINDSVNENSVINLFSNNSEKSDLYFMNGAGDISDGVNELIDILDFNTVKKQSSIKSYLSLFTFGKKDFVLMGKSISSQYEITIYTKDDSVYILLVQYKDDSDRIPFAFYQVKNEQFSQQILQYKANENRYYGYFPKWVGDIATFNMNGKLLVLAVVIEVVLLCVVINKKCLKTRQVKTSNGSKSPKG